MNQISQSCDWEKRQHELLPFIENIDHSFVSSATLIGFLNAKHCYNEVAL